MDNAVPNFTGSFDWSKVARHTTDSFADFSDRLTKANVGTALKSVVMNVYVARFVISLLIIVFGITCSILYVKYNNSGDAKKQSQLAYVSQLWFGKNESGLTWLLCKVWLTTFLFLVGAPLIFKLLEVWGAVR